MYPRFLTQLNSFFLSRLHWLFQIATICNASLIKDITCYLNEPSSPILSSLPHHNTSCKYSDFHDSHVSVSVQLILSNQLLIIALESYCPTNYLIKSEPLLGRFLLFLFNLWGNSRHFQLLFPLACADSYMLFTC